VGDGTVPLAIVLYIDGSFVKHKIPVRPIYITVRNLNSVVSGKAHAWRVLGMMPSVRKCTYYVHRHTLFIHVRVMNIVCTYMFLQCTLPFVLNFN
jgi:hypothetical protein